jgi:hypothetical protein
MAGGSGCRSKSQVRCFRGAQPLQARALSRPATLAETGIGQDAGKNLMRTSGEPALWGWVRVHFVNRPASTRKNRRFSPAPRPTAPRPRTP